MTRRAALVALLLALLLPASALAAPPPNDDRANARPISLPSDVSGTTVGATVEPTDPFSCEAPASTVWYSFTGRGRRVVLRARAGGDLDAVISVFRARRSQLTEEACDIGDESGEASVDVETEAGARYLVRVARRPNSAEGPFTLSTREVSPPATPPGAPLPRGGVRRTLDRVLNTSDAWSVNMRAGRSYRVNLTTSADACVRYALYAPGTEDFDSSSPLRSRSCGGGYLVFTPKAGQGGRHTIRVLADRSHRGPQPYRLQAARAGRDDLAPGIFIRNHRRVRGRLDGLRVDVRDLYRFDVTSRSILDLRLNARFGGNDFDLLLLNDRGRRLECACESGGDERIRRRLRPGRYFVAVEAAGRSRGRYALTRASRTITRTRTLWNGRRGARVAPGRRVTLGVRVPPRASGLADVTLERFDPVEGWRFYRHRVVRVRRGRAALGFRPPSVGRYRARTEFRGSRSFAPSASRYAHLLVAAPLRD